MFTGELFIPANFESAAYAANVSAIKDAWYKKVEQIFTEATLQVPKQEWAQSGGKQGKHTEHLGYLLTELQYLQRVYPNATW